MRLPAWSFDFLELATLYTNYFRRLNTVFIKFIPFFEVLHGGFNKFSWEIMLDFCIY